MRNEKENPMNRQWKVGLSLMAITLLGASRVQAGTTADATITVTPVTSVSIALSPATYAFGNLDVNTSSITASALQLSNDGQVSVTVKKHIETESTPSGWTRGTAAGADQYALFVATASARPASGVFNSTDHVLALGDGSKDDLKGAGSANVPTIAPAGNVDLWFRLDMPTTVTAQTARSIGVRFTAVGL
jgi:hypothetical protein